jgi:acetyl-CoA synthetase
MIQSKQGIVPHLYNYEKVSATFSWDEVDAALNKLPDGKGLNIAYEAVDRHADGALKNTIA